MLRAIAEPYTRPDSIRVELVAMHGEVIVFKLGGGSVPVAAVYDGQRYVRQGHLREHVALVEIADLAMPGSAVEMIG